MLNIPTLRDKAITVRLSRHMYNPYKYDKGATDAAEASIGAHKAGRYTKRLLRTCKELKEAQQAYAGLYEYIMDNTLPWMDDGVRVLPNESYMDFASEVSRLKANCAAKVQRLYEVWDARVVEDRLCLSGMWDIRDYPTKDDMLKRWGADVVFAPVPCSADFRIDMDEEDKKELDEAVKEVEDKATGYLITEILKPVQAMASKLAVPIGEEGAIFRDTLVSNVNDVCRRARKLNINNDSRIDEAVKSIEDTMRSITPQTLRESQQVRETTQKRMSDLQKKLSQWL